MRKLCFIDVETTGTDYKKSGLIQIAGVIVTGKKETWFDLAARPFDGDYVSQGALKVTGLTKEKIFQFPEPRVTYADFVSMLDLFVDKYNKRDKMFFVGYNAYFDMQHMREWFRKNGNPYFDSYFFFPPLDVAILACKFLMNERRKMENFRLVTVARTLGIDVDEEKLHNAKYDIELTRRMYTIVKDGGTFKPALNKNP